MFRIRADQKTGETDFFYFQRQLIETTAQWPFAQRDSPFYCLSYFYQVLMVILPLHLAILHAKSLYDHWGEGIDSLSDFITSIIIYSFCFYTTAFFILFHKKLQKLVNCMNKNFKIRSEKGITYVSVDDCFKKAKTFTYLWTAACAGGVILWALYPIMIQERSLPLRCWYPFDEKQPVVYEILYAIQFFAQLQVGMAFGCSSGVYVVLIILICGQYDILFCSFKNLMDSADILAGCNIEGLRNRQAELDLVNDELNQYYCSKELIDPLIDCKKKDSAKRKSPLGPKESMQEALKKCVKHHQDILNVCEILEDFFSPFCLIKSLQITFQLCFLVFISANQTTISVLRSINLIQYLLLTGTELLLVTYYGETIRAQSLRVGEALLRSPWFTRSALIRKEILIILPNALRPIKLTAGKFYPMDVERLRSVVTSAFSYFTLLQNLKA